MQRDNLQEGGGGLRVLGRARADPLLPPYGFPSAHSFPRPSTTPATLILGSEHGINCYLFSTAYRFAHVAHAAALGFPTVGCHGEQSEAMTY